MKIAPSIRTALQAIDASGQATIPDLVANDEQGGSKSSWQGRVLRAMGLELVCVERTEPASTYRLTKKGRDALAGRSDDAPMSMVAQTVRSQPKSVWELGVLA